MAFEEQYVYAVSYITKTSMYRMLRQFPGFCHE